MHANCICSCEWAGGRLLFLEDVLDNPIIEIEILNWEKFNPRKDVKATSWFRLDNRFCVDPKFFDLSNDYKMVWIWLLSHASQELAGVVQINLSLVSTMITMPADDVLDCLKIFEKRNVIKIRGDLRDASDRTCNANVRVRTATNERTNETDVTNERTNGKVPPNSTGIASRSPLKSKLDFDESDLSLAERWSQYASEKQPWRKFNTAKFADAIRRVRNSVGLDSAQMVGLFEFATTHEFWADNVISPAGLLKKSSRNDLRKIDNLLAEMKRKCDKVQAVSDWVKNGDSESFDPFQGVK